MQDLNEKLKNIKLLAMDFDGVMTDGFVFVNQDGTESVKCSRKDGLGLLLLNKNGIETVVISKETNPVVKARCKKLQIEFWQAVENGDGKLEILLRHLKDKGLTLDETAYIGDDLNDLAVLRRVGLSVTVADGHASLKNVCHYVTQARGGEHAVREVCELILAVQNKSIEY